MISNHTQTLQDLFGFSSFRSGQQEVVDSLLNQRSSLAIFPTGSGKSLCYQFVATQLPHLTLVVSPLLALMKDQIAFLHSKDIAAASIDSTLTAEQNKQVMNDVRSGECKILMVSVERFKNERFRQFIESIQVSMLVIDEAHCISEWGHNFRPDYLKLPAYQQELNIPLVLLLTATATKKVKLDMARRFDIAPENIVQTGFYRPNLNLNVLPVVEKNKNQALLEELQRQQGAGIVCAGIVYVTLQQTAEQVARFLQQNGVAASAYHAGLDSDIRQNIQQDFMVNKLQVVVATIAFGMGIDKSDIRFVVHYDLPKSIENYSQEIGRGGRDGQNANCTVLANLDGLVTIENFVYGDTPDKSAIERVIKDIASQAPEQSASSSYVNSSIDVYQWETQINSLSTLSNIRQLPLKTLLVQLELAKVIRPLYAYFAEFKYRFNTDKADILNLFSKERSDFLNAVFTHTDMKKVWGVVNFDSIFEHYGAERARVVAALEYLHEHNHIELASRLITDVYEVNQQALLADDLPNSLAENLAHYFAENERKEVKRIAALVRFFELNTCLNYNLSAYFDDQQAPQECGHCSVCNGKVAKLDYSTPIPLPDKEQVTQAMAALNSHLEGKFNETITESIYCRFLTAMTMPLFTRLKVRQVVGFGSCEFCRYADVKAVVTEILDEGARP
ncbi:Recombinase RecQ [Alteromonas sp. 38]|uniref:RecQ family ATP-dependent DNA helicase n=1 Tax=unclassified Alteromonas TaxID=2614992 RepID=UPI0012F160EC|nr:MULTISPECIES: RecQ family ATP-dependent DNA helicase [unclassified Alteromonas]CAD5263879.1 Recombinase RecQ [Alteromonas sp. 154]VXC18114.1 Recombinase RecQ [Alteromonas sp. 38]